MAERSCSSGLNRSEEAEAGHERETGDGPSPRNGAWNERQFRLHGHVSFSKIVQIILQPAPAFVDPHQQIENS
jgi:hypothetical protein